MGLCEDDDEILKAGGDFNDSDSDGFDCDC